MPEIANFNDFMSEAERTFIVHGIQVDSRTDGRKRNEFRPIQIETGLLSNCVGSSRIHISATEIVVGVKANIIEPDSLYPSRGQLHFHINSSKNAGSQFEAENGESVINELLGILNRSYTPGCSGVNLDKLCVVSNHYVWEINVDILILGCCGNIRDAVSIAVKCALFNTRLPNLKLCMGEKGEVDYEIPDDPYDVTSLDIDRVPLIITVTKVGHSNIVDATSEEESCSLSRILIAVTENGNITALKSLDHGSLHMQSINDMIKLGVVVGKNLNIQVTASLRNEESEFKTKSKKCGYLI